MRRSFLIACAIFAVAIVSSQPCQAGVYSGGAGTEAEPYLIGNAADWQELAATPGDWIAGRYFALAADIDFEGATIVPVAGDTDASTPDFQGTAFAGILDGAGHSLGGFVIDQPDSDFAAPLGCIAEEGAVRNLRVESFTVTGRAYAGGLCGSNRGEVDSCSAAGSVTGDWNIGGLVGENKGTIFSCQAAATVLGSGSYVGGLCGYDKNGMIGDSSATGAVHGRSAVGGLCGLLDGGMIGNCFATGDVSGNGSLVGGLCGNSYDGTIVGCYATGAASGTSGIGGLCGYNELGTIHASCATGAAVGSELVGGLCGENEAGIISQSYATGAARGSDKIGGLLGYNWRGKVIQCYSIGKPAGSSNVGGLCGLADTEGDYEDTGNFWDTQTSRARVSAMGAGKATRAMKTQSTFDAAAWDFENAWRMSQAGSVYKGYPVLRWQASGSAITKFTVRAGRIVGADCMQFAGVLDAAAADVESADSLILEIDSEDLINPIEWVIPIDETTFKRGRLCVRDGGASFSLDTRTGKMAVAGKNMDLSGLACPITVTISVGELVSEMTVNEDIVNGPRNPCPPQLLMGIRNWMMIGKATVKFGRKPNTDSLSVCGFFAVADDYDKDQPVIISLGEQSFTVAGDQFTTNAKSATERCTKSVSAEGPLVSATFNFAKGTFQIQVTKAAITADGPVEFGVDCFDQALPAVQVNVVRP